MAAFDYHYEDLLIGRSYNRTVFANIIFGVTPKPTTGFEVAFWKTLYRETHAGQVDPSLLGPTEPADSTVFQWMVPSPVPKS